MKRAFTLIEMTVVLLIIAIVTHLAMRQLSVRMDDKKTAAANRQLEEIRDSVFSYDREDVPTGFLADMGRLAYATNGTLNELWQMPAGAKPYAVLPATKANLAKGAPSGLEESSVFVPTGWRGPYLRLPIGKKRLMDPWGNAFENPDAAGYNRLALSNKFAVAVSHFGATALSNDVHRQSISLVPTGGASARLFVSAFLRNGSEKPTTVDYKWFGPKDGLITGGVAKSVPFGTTATLTGLTPGVRVVFAEYSTSNAVPTKVTRLVTIRPGDNQLQIEIP